MNPIHFLIGAPCELPPGVLWRWPELHEACYRRGGLPLRFGGWVLGARSVAGFTLGRTVWLQEGVGFDPQLLLHEIRHVQQFRERSHFAIRYLWESLRHGYASNRYEIEAQRYAERRLPQGERRADSSLTGIPSILDRRNLGTPDPAGGVEQRRERAGDSEQRRQG